MRSGLESSPGTSAHASSAGHHAAADCRTDDQGDSLRLCRQVHTLRGKRGNRVQDVINISIEGGFVAVAIGYSFIPPRPNEGPTIVNDRGIDFTYSIVDSGSGRELQNRPIHNIAGLGEATGRRPFRPLAKPMLFMPRSTIRIEVEEISEGHHHGCRTVHRVARLQDAGLRNGAAMNMNQACEIPRDTGYSNVCQICGVPLDAGYFDVAGIKDAPGVRRQKSRSRATS